MLPFLKPKKQASVLVVKNKAEGGLEPMHEEGEHAPGMIDFMQELIDAIHSKDAAAAADAFMAASHFADAEPHEEGEHLEEEEY